MSNDDQLIPVFCIRTVLNNGSSCCAYGPNGAEVGTSVGHTCVPEPHCNVSSYRWFGATD